MKQPLKILSLGAGVQSTTLLLMSCRGVLPKLDAAIFADVQWEPPAVYEHLSWLEHEAAKAGISVHRVTNGNLRKQTVEVFTRRGIGRGTSKRKRYTSMPFYVLNPSGTQGMIRRQCTSEYKIVPIERFIRQTLLNLKSKQKAPANCVEQWFGISVDEQQRTRISMEKWKTNVYPLLNHPHDMLTQRYTRRQCLEWLHQNYPGRNVPRSACIGCPFHNDEEWRHIKNDPALWADAIEVDEAIRQTEGMDGQVFLHRSCLPLKEVDLRTPREKGQMDFGFEEECFGYCGN